MKMVDDEYIGDMNIISYQAVIHAFYALEETSQWAVYNYNVAVNAGIVFG